MPKYRGKLLDTSKLLSGIQVVAYNLDTNNKVDTVISDAKGFYQFNDLSVGGYEIRFFGGGYSQEDWITVYISEAFETAIQYFISAPEGSVVKNNTGSLQTKLNQITSGEVIDVLEGDVKLYYRSGGSLLPVSGLSNSTSSNEYSVDVAADDIPGTLTLIAASGVGTASEFIYDSITLADLSDGVGFIGYVEPSTFVTVKDEFGAYSPATITITPKFAFDGVELPTDPTTDANFSWTTRPTADAANGVSVNAATGVVTITAADYFDQEATFTAS